MRFSKLAGSPLPCIPVAAEKFLVLVAFLVPFLAGASPARGQGVSLGANPDSALAAKVEGLEGAPLSLEEAFGLAQEQSTEVQAAASALVAAQQAVRREKGTFDPELFVDLDRLSNDQPSASPFAGADVLMTDDTRVAGGARMQLRFGTELEASLNTVRTRTNSQFTTLNPEINTFGLVTVRQPLLSGFGPSARVNLTVAERTAEEAQARYNDAVFSVRTQVENLYWDLYATERFLAVLQVITEQAEALLREAELRQAAGLGSPNQVANARSFLSQQQIDQLDGQEVLDRTSDQLAALLGTRPGDGRLRFHPVDAPPSDYSLVPVDDLLTEARRSNYRLIASQARLETFRALSRAAGWNALPDLDLVGSLGANGLAGTEQDVDFPIADSSGTSFGGNFGDTWDQIWRGEFPQWSVGLQLTVPIGLREGKGERDRLRAETRIAEQGYEAELRSLDVEVRTAHRAMMNGAARLEAARNGVDAAAEQVRIGLIEYRNGRSTAFELVILGADFARAQRRYSQALVRTAKAAAELRRLTSGAYPEENLN